jgi:hypothetical protein
MVNIKNNGWDLVQTGDSGKVFVFIGTAEADIDDLPTVDVGSGSTAIRQDGKKYLFHEDSGWVEFAG